MVRTTVAALIFAAGFLSGSVLHRPAAAQLGEAIVDMQKHVDGLQKNIDVLKKVKTSLGG